MNKNIKKIVAIALTVSAFSAIAPATNLNIMSTKAYAADNDKDELEKLVLETSGGSTIKLYDSSSYKNKVDSGEVNDDGVYYAKTSSNKVQIDTSGPKSKYVRIFKGTSSSTRGVKEGDDISLESGTNKLTVRVYSEEPESRVKYSNKDNVVSEYKINVKYTGNSSNDDGNSQDEVYLKSISLSDGDISFSKKTSTYNINVGTSVDEIRITAKPDCDEDDYDNYEVRIDGSKVDEDDKFRRTVSLNKGKNEIKVTVENTDDDTKRTYTLNINRGTTSDTNKNESSTPSAPANNNNVKANQWVQLSNGKWTYNDSTGNTIKNMWFTDRNYGKTYYLQADGTMATGWLFKDGVWYYLAGSGEKQTGWTLDGGNWYYLDSEGRMQTGWLKDRDGKWYFLQSSGAMAKNTIISGYKLGSNGAWIN